MNGAQKLFLIIIGMVMVGVAVHYGLGMLNPGVVSPEDIQVSEKTQEEQIDKEKEKVSAT